MPKTSKQSVEHTDFTKITYPIYGRNLRGNPVAIVGVNPTFARLYGYRLSSSGKALRPLTWSITGAVTNDLEYRNLDRTSFKDIVFPDIVADKPLTEAVSGEAVFETLRGTEYEINDKYKITKLKNRQYSVSFEDDEDADIETAEEQPKVVLSVTVDEKVAAVLDAPEIEVAGTAPVATDSEPVKKAAPKKAASKKKVSS